jgi:hypothetical protein
MKFLLGFIIGMICMAILIRLYFNRDFSQCDSHEQDDLLKLQDDLVKLTELEYLDSKIRFELAGQAVYALAGWMAYWFQESGGKNYVELSMYHEDTGPLIFTVQRLHGQTPDQLKKKAEQLLDEAGDVLREWPLGHGLREKAMATYLRIVER